MTSPPPVVVPPRYYCPTCSETDTPFETDLMAEAKSHQTDTNHTLRIRFADNTYQTFGEVTEGK